MAKSFLGTDGRRRRDGHVRVVRGDRWSIAIGSPRFPRSRPDHGDGRQRRRTEKKQARSPFRQKEELAPVRRPNIGLSRPNYWVFWKTEKKQAASPFRGKEELTPLAGPNIGLSRPNYWVFWKAQ